MKCLTGEQLLGAPRARPVPVPLPHLGPDACVYVRSLRACELDELQFVWADEKEREQDPNYRGRLVALCACDEAGAPLFGEHQAAQLAQLDVALVDPIVEAAQKLNGLSAREKESLRKNSSTAPAGGSSSG